MAIKAQALADFIAEYAFNEEKDLRKKNRKEEGSGGRTEVEGEDSHVYQWKLHIDRAAGPSQNGLERY